jgi:hypothetical protein
MRPHGPAPTTMTWWLVVVTCNYRSSTTVFSMAPTRSISTRTTSPGEVRRVADFLGGHEVGP